ncbi:MAG TPA: sigma-70 family RNA polymerase sigma factor [Conexibacter sp.]|jgi:RNA polymerase sigma-70 factor (ECF subfamily)
MDEIGRSAGKIGGGPRDGSQVQLSAAGEQEELNALYVRYRREVYRHARRIVASHDDAEDVTQQVFLKLTTRVGRYDTSRAEFSAWMRRAARNAAIDYLRRDRLRLCAGTVDEEMRSQSVDLDRGTTLREAIECLPSGQRDVLLLRDVAGLTPTEVARRLGKSRGAVNTCHHRARVAVRRTLESQGSTPATHTVGSCS